MFNSRRANRLTSRTDKLGQCGRAGDDRLSTEEFKHAVEHRDREDEHLDDEQESRRFRVHLKREEHRTHS